MSVCRFAKIMCYTKHSNCVVFSQEAKEFTPKHNGHTLSVSKECNCLFYYAEYDPDEFKKQGKDWMKVGS